MADRFVEPLAVKWAPMIPGILISIGAVWAAVTSLVQTSLVPLGPAVALSAILTLQVLGDDRGKGVIREKVLSWIKVWPLWEYLFLLIVVAWFGMIAVLHDCWIALVLGLVCGVAIAAIYYLVVVLPLRPERDQIATEFHRRLAQEMGDVVSSRVQENSHLVQLMGPNWIPLFQRLYGYEAYRETANTWIGRVPDRLSRQPIWHDFLCDLLSESIRFRRGLLRLLMSVTRCSRYMVERQDVRCYIAELTSVEAHANLSLKEITELADAWWAAAENSRTIPYQRAARHHAVQLYKRVLPSVSDPMDQVLIKSRIDVVIDG